MVQVISEYVRNIAMFLLFMSFIGIIIPNNKYKSYINLIMGFVLIFIVLSPISNVIATNSLNLDDIFENLESDSMSLDDSFIIYEDFQNSLVLDLLERDLIEQLDSIVKEHGFSPVSISIDMNEDDLFNIENIYIHMLKIENKNKEDSSFIHIERISINSNVNENIQEEYTEEIKILKNYISSFYNLSVDNIHITVQD